MMGSHTEDNQNPEDINTFLMQFEENRLFSFKDWPFDKECNCTPEKMAEAGFYHTPTDCEPDLVRCFVCGKELDGWEPSDDPWEEHKSHAAKCPFLKIKDHKSITITSQLKLMQARYTTMVRKEYEKKIEELQNFAKEAREKMEALV